MTDSTIVILGIQVGSVKSAIVRYSNHKNEKCYKQGWFSGKAERGFGFMNVFCGGVKIVINSLLLWD